MPRNLSQPKRPIPFAVHRLRRKDPVRVAAEAERDADGLLPVVPGLPPRQRAGKRGKPELTRGQRKQQAQALATGRPTLRQRLRAAAAAVAAAVGLGGR